MVHTIELLIPCFNEAECLGPLFLALETACRQEPDLEWTLIVVNDGSLDRTRDVALHLLEQSRGWCQGRLIDLSRNFGKEAALIAGLDQSQADACIIMDADMQDPPELLRDMIQAWREGAEVVSARRTQRHSENPIKVMTAALFYRIFRATSKLDVQIDASDFRLLDRRVVKAIIDCRETVRFSKGFFAWVGFRQVEIPYRQASRAGGMGKWGAWKLWNYALDGIFSFSTAPLRIWSYLGLIVTCLSFLLGIIAIARTLILGVDVPGYASLLTTITFLGGIQLIGIGMIGEYLGRTYMESKRRPTYVIRSVHEV